MQTFLDRGKPSRTKLARFLDSGSGPEQLLASLLVCQEETFDQCPRGLDLLARSVARARGWPEALFLKSCLDCLGLEAQGVPEAQLETLSLEPGGYLVRESFRVLPESPDTDWLVPDSLSREPLLPQDRYSPWNSPVGPGPLIYY